MVVKPWSTHFFWDQLRGGGICSHIAIINFVNTVHWNLWEISDLVVPWKNLKQTRKYPKISKKNCLKIPQKYHTNTPKKTQNIPRILMLEIGGSLNWFKIFNPLYYYLSKSSKFVCSQSIRERVIYRPMHVYVFFTISG